MDKVIDIDRAMAIENNLYEELVAEYGRSASSYHKQLAEWLKELKEYRKLVDIRSVRDPILMDVDVVKLTRAECLGTDIDKMFELALIKLKEKNND